MVCGARLNINLWQAVAKEGRRRVEWTGQLSSLPAVWLSREEKCTGRLCSVPLKCDMRSLTYKLNVTTGGQFYFNRGDHRQATIHFPPFFLSPPLLRFLLFSPPPLLLLFPPLSLLLIRPGPTLSPILARSNRGLDRRPTTKIHRGSIIDHAPSIIPFPSSRPFVYGFLCGICGLRKARVVNSRCGENENIRSCSPIPTRFSLIPFVVVEVVRSSNKGFVGENEYEFPITRSRWKREIWKIFEGTHEKNCQHFLFPVFSVHPPTIPGSGDRSEAIYPPGRNPFFFFFPLLSSPLIREFVARRSWGRPPSFCAEFRLEMLNWRTKKTRETKKRDILQRERERLSKTGRRAVWYPFVNSPKGSWLCAAMW